MRGISREPLTLFPDTPRICSTCRTPKTPSDFPKAKRNRDGLGSQCKDCAGYKQKQWHAANKERDAETRKNWRAANMPTARASAQKYKAANKPKIAAAGRLHRLRAYGLTPEERDAALENQMHRCAACDKNLDLGHRTHIDHCHKTGRFRGILCGGCNTALGFAKENPTTLRALAAYIERHSLQADSPTCEIATAATDAADTGANDNGTQERQDQLPQEPTGQPAERSKEAAANTRRRTQIGD